MTGANPFDWYGGAFLALYALLFVAALIASFAIAAWLRPDGGGMLNAPGEFAMLRSSPDRFAETQVLPLLQCGALAVEQGRLIKRRPPPQASEVQQSILALISWSRLRRVTDDEAAVVERQLIARGLLMDKGEAVRLGQFAALPLLLLIGFGYAKYEIGVMRERPVAFLIVFLVVTGIAVLLRWFVTDRRTRAGIAQWEGMRARSARLRQAAPREEMALAVALFGTAVLAGSPLAEFHDWRKTGDGGSSGDSGGDGDGGGGGCGGCG
jgi:uncharacterized protein (TIGR04222 family)